MENLELILAIIFGAIILVCSIIYYSDSNLNSCFVCEKPFKSIKQHRVWWEFDGTKRPVCLRCDKKLEKEMEQGN
ncbi:hypothetical protein [Idiomarina ramblicola]|uniref:hypothetical protein n=1 Tax=Idiomarina ramblicola TaxID=263724 RepID=UPI000F889DAD|nr:hypothetical protein [Idiomarina ramblicola]